MPLPLIIGGIAAVAGIAGAGSGIHGGVKLKKASNTMRVAKSLQEELVEDFKDADEYAMEKLDELGEKELTILDSFNNFADAIEKIQNRPEFKTITKQKIKLPEYTPEEIKNVSAGAGVLLGGIGGTTAGVAGGFAAAGATTSAVMALGTASTGTAISTLSGAAATNATLAALGGGSLAAHGGGMALGSVVLGGATLGVGLLIGGVIFNVTGSKVSEKAEDALDEVLRADTEGRKVVRFLSRLGEAAEEYETAIDDASEKYYEHLNNLNETVIVNGKTDWNDFTDEEMQNTENTVLLVNLLYHMCKVNLVNKGKTEKDINTINETEIEEAINQADSILSTLQ